MVTARRRALQNKPLLAAPPASFEMEIQAQTQSPLYSLLPAELRLMIFEYVLTDYESTDYFHVAPPVARYGRHLGYAALAAPDYRPRRHTATELLRTCQRVYHETWLMPFTLAENIFNVSGFEIRTNCDTQYQPFLLHVSRHRMTAYIKTVKEYAIAHNLTLNIPHIRNTRLYVRTEYLQGDYQRLKWAIRIPEVLGPKCVTVSLNYRNRWNAINLNLSADWVNGMEFPESVKCIRMELGKFSLGTRVGEITSKVIKNWFFRREDGMIFRATEEDISFRHWSAILPQDEISLSLFGAFPATTYVIPTVAWRPAEGFDPFVDGYKCPDLDLTRIAFSEN